MTTPHDIIGRPINIGDYVVFTNNIYVVVGINGYGYAKIMLFNPSSTTRPVSKYSKYLCVLPAIDVANWRYANKNSTS